MGDQYERLGWVLACERSVAFASSVASVAASFASRHTMMTVARDDSRSSGSVEGGMRATQAVTRS